MKIKLKLIIASFLICTSCTGTSIPKIIEKSEDKVVKIGIVLDNGKEMRGSGSFVFWDGTVLTCAHVVNHKGIKKVFVKLSNETIYMGEITKVDVIHDLALIKLLKTPPFKRFSYFRLGEPVEKGQQVLLFGSPLGIQGCVTVVWVENILTNAFDSVNTLVIHSAFTNPGNSGGPLVDLHGKLVGVGEAIVMLNPFIAAEGLSIAIDVENIREFIESH